MLIGAQHQATVRSDAGHQGLPNASVNDAQHATVSPAWAKQPMLAAHRVAKLPAQKELMRDVFTDTRFPHQPTRKTLVDTIRVLSATGNVSAQQAQYLADNVSHPNRLWSAIETLSQTAANDPNDTINSAVYAKLLRDTPVKDMAAFVTQWAKVLPEVADPQLIAQLHAAKRTLEDGTTDRWFDWGTFNSAFIGAVEKVATELNSRMKQVAYFDDDDTNEIDFTLEFSVDVERDGGLIVGADHSMGLVMEHAYDDTQTDYWKALVHGLNLINEHLLPIVNTVDLLDQSGMMFEEYEQDLTGVWNYLSEHDLEDTLENIEKALEVTEPCMIEEAEMFEEIANQYHRREETKQNWELEGDLSIDAFKARVAALNEPNTAEERLLVNWFHDLAAALDNKPMASPWAGQLTDYLVSGECFYMLNEFTPVYGVEEVEAHEAADDQHHFFMQGDDREFPKFGWRTDAKLLLGWADSMKIGQKLVMQLMNNPDRKIRFAD
ncbi:hypothetical protein AWH63_11005 [Marinobacter sp. C18]|uniref:hypothetical protein n=1 Tax=Marinobacter sp. C18 TaxID=1772288 RepID=UPI0009490C4A|nr:hypothetical protein [Marinobacter sp. C18]OLF82060.1 hypothetical protein AWH63_11005 [Marinobacter sp. C18]